MKTKGADWTLEQWSQPFVGTDLKPTTHRLYVEYPEEAYHLRPFSQLPVTDEPVPLRTTEPVQYETTHQRLFGPPRPVSPPGERFDRPSPLVDMAPLAPGEAPDAGAKFEGETTNQRMMGHL